jgi:hypothetical protein
MKKEKEVEIYLNIYKKLEIEINQVKINQKMKKHKVKVVIMSFN